jgi:predicted DNA-binding transcriptional regulator YafY
MTWLPVVARAVWGERRMEMTYVRADNRELQYTLDPLGLVLKGGQWYLVAWMGEYDVTFRVSRIRHASVRDEAVQRPNDFDLAEYWAASVKEFDEFRAQVRVRLRVHVSAADDLPRLLGEGLRFQLDERLPDASPDGFVELDLSYESLSDARADLLGVGPSIEVVEPAALRIELAAVAAGVVELYAATPS